MDWRQLFYYFQSFQTRHTHFFCSVRLCVWYLFLNIVFARARWKEHFECVKKWFLTQVVFRTLLSQNQTQHTSKLEHWAVINKKRMLNRTGVFGEYLCFLFSKKTRFFVTLIYFRMNKMLYFVIRSTFVSFDVVVAAVISKTVFLTCIYRTVKTKLS